VTWPGGQPIQQDPRREIADRIWRQRHSHWVVWWGEHSQHFWAIATWVRGPAGVIQQKTPDALVAAMNHIEMIYPKPEHPA
jgi:hypothetical protein